VFSNPNFLVCVIAISGLAIPAMDTMWAEALSGCVRAVSHEEPRICGSCTPMREGEGNCKRNSRVWGFDDGGLSYTRCV
jgi:hypothetical protein